MAARRPRFYASCCASPDVDVVRVDTKRAPGELPETASTRYDTIEPLGAPDPERCLRVPPRMPGGTEVGVMHVTDLRLDPATLPFGDSPPPPDAQAELQGWTRFADGRDPDPLSLLYFNDAIPPATFRIGSAGWVPTLQMSAYVRARPLPGWLGIRMTANLVADGMVDETCVLWDSTGQVVAQASQLARLRFADDRREPPGDGRDPGRPRRQRVRNLSEMSTSRRHAPRR